MAAACSSLRWRVAVLVALLLFSLLDQVGGFHVRMFSQTGRRGSLASGVLVKKIEEEESTIKKMSAGGKKTKTESSWREKQRQKEMVPMSSASAEDALSNPQLSLLEEEEEIEVEVPHAQDSNTAAAMEPIMASDMDAAATLQFIDAMKGGVDNMEALFDGPGSSGSKERADRDRQREQGQGQWVNPMDGVLRVPKKDPMSGGVLPPEVVFFGEPRKPPPVATAGRVEYHSTLLMWARHGNVVPRDSAERLRSVFPKGAQEKGAERLRLAAAGLSYGVIYSAWTAVMEDLEEAKRFIAVNLDLVPPKMFLRAITAKKLAAQSRGDVPEMRRLMHVRSKYILASDQLFFPLNIERLKAETRVMTYLARDELRTFSAPWDEVECSLHMTSLMAARLHWDRRAEIKLEQIKEVVANTVEYMREKTYNNLMSTVFRKPALTSQTYNNASVNIQTLMPALYAKVAPEVKVLHETYEMVREGRFDDVRRHVEGVVCPREGLSLDELKFRLRLFDATVSNIQVRAAFICLPPLPPIHKLTSPSFSLYRASTTSRCRGCARKCTACSAPRLRPRHCISGTLTTSTRATASRPTSPTRSRRSSRTTSASATRATPFPTFGCKS